MRVNPSQLKRLPHRLHRYLDGRPQLKTVLANTGWLLADKVVRISVGFLIIVWLARFLGPEQFGILSYALAFFSLFTAFATLGLDGIVVRDLVQKADSDDRVLGTAFALKCFAAVGGAFFGLVSIWLLRPSDVLMRSFVAILMAGGAFYAFDVIEFWFQARVEARFSVLAKNTAFLVASLGKALLILLGAPLIAFAVVQSTEILLGAVGLIIVFHLRGGRISRWRFDAAVARRLAKDGWPLVLASLAVVIYMRIDQIMVGEMLGDHYAGVYTAAMRVAEVWYFIPVSIVASVTPAIIQAKQVGSDLYYERISRLFRLLFIIAVGIAVPVTLFADRIAALLYGEIYDGVGSVLALQIWTGVFVFLGVAQTPWTVAEKQAKLALFRTGVGALANVLLNFVLIPIYGVLGAAIATVIAQALSSVILNAASKSTRKIFVLQLKAMLLVVK